MGARYPEELMSELELASNEFVYIKHSNASRESVPFLVRYWVANLVAADYTKISTTRYQYGYS